MCCGRILFIAGLVRYRRAGWELLEDHGRQGGGQFVAAIQGGCSWCTTSCGGLARSLDTMIARFRQDVTSTQGPSLAGSIGQGTGSVVSSTRTAQERGRLTGGRPGGWTTQRGSSWPGSRVWRSTLTTWPANGWQARITRTFRTPCDALGASCELRPLKIYRSFRPCDENTLDVAESYQVRAT